MAILALGVRDVARGLFQIRHQSAALEHFGEHVRRVLHRKVDAAELRHRVVAVVVEHPRVQPLGALESDGRGAGGAADLGIELVEEQASQRLGRPRIAREQRALHGLRQIHERKDRPVEVREVRRDGRLLGLGERR